jgi:hypothetical protein
MFVPSGSLADHLPYTESANMNALAMRYLHARECIMRMGDFGGSIRVNECHPCDSRLAIDPR